jgi:hypothetical protein
MTAPAKRKAIVATRLIILVVSTRLLSTIARVEALEQDFRAETLSGVGEVDHGTWALIPL